MPLFWVWVIEFLVGFDMNLVLMLVVVMGVEEGGDEECW